MAKWHNRWYFDWSENFNPLDTPLNTSTVSNMTNNMTTSRSANSAIVGFTSLGVLMILLVAFGRNQENVGRNRARRGFMDPPSLREV